MSVDTRPPAPPIAPYNNPASFTLEYNASCNLGQSLRWTFLDWKAVTPEDSRIEFHAQTYDDPAVLHDPILVGTAAGDPSVNHWTGADIGGAFQLAPPPAGPVRSRANLRITVTLHPSSDGFHAPTLLDRRVRFTCKDAE